MRKAAPLAAAIAVALVPGTLLAQSEAPAGKTLDAVVVTGSNIKRTDAEGPSPVQVIDRVQLEQSGKQTVADVLRSISANTGNAYNETYNNGWASGAAGIGLRGLSQKNTLVLLNGRRLANYGFPQGGLSDTFVNLNALPLVAVERIEVLKDGASAVYGSDAVAGVINIITRQNAQDVEVGASVGTSTEGGADQNHFTLVGGVGDLEADRFNVLYSFEYFQRDRLDQDERDLTKSGIYSDKPGGRWNGWSAKGARLLGANGASIPLLDANGNCPEGTVLTASAPIDGRAGNTCAFNVAPYTTLIPGTERYQAYVTGTYLATDDVEVFGEALYSYIRGDSIFGSSPYFTLESGRFALNAQTGLAEPVPAVLPAGNPYNPFGVDTPIEYTFFDLGQSKKINTSHFYRVLGGVRGRTDRWDWESTVFASKSRERETVTAGFANRYGLAAALADGSYNLLNPSATPQAVIDSINLSTVRPAESELNGVDFKVTGDLFDLPAGSVGFAAGAEWREEKLRSSNPWQIDAGLQIRPAIAEVDGQRDVAAVYAEFNVPLASSLEVQLAGRGDHYSDFGNAFSPKASLRWQPLDWLLVRAAASRGFRAPSLSENADSTNISYGAVVDPYDPNLPNSTQRPTFFTVGNSDLDPERTRSYNLGFVLSPLANTSVSVDYYRIKLDNLIGTNNTTAIVNRNDPSDVIRDANGKLVAVYNRYQNLSELETSGIDVELSQRWRTASAGDFNLSSVYTHVLEYKRPATVGGPPVDYAGSNLGPALPRNKATTSLGWDIADVSTSLTWYYTGGYDQRTVIGPGIPARVDAGNQFDLYVGYKGFEGWTLYAKVQNLFDEEPPYDPAGFAGLRVPYDITQYDLRGRYVTLGFDYRF
ncbi:TonB-dependent receptor plug domain-containing protein [Lysobacter niastensis]|uniref:TonB-dependent receptor n=1 Tax=Lysobacter niastensis TaxID=380629 RepID=A0ABS0B4A6_9GAMM|nr:TonB-dependent receptor [Lysobacter niastensis]MBF6023426.1 TonB-dependent receptor [Lysobacter niastensis]